MYVAVKGGESAIRNSQQLLAEERRGDRNVEELTLDQIQNQTVVSANSESLDPVFLPKYLSYH